LFFSLALAAFSIGGLVIGPQVHKFTSLIQNSNLKFQIKKINNNPKLLSFLPHSNKPNAQSSTLSTSSTKVSAQLPAGKEYPASTPSSPK